MSNYFIAKGLNEYAKVYGRHTDVSLQLECIQKLQTPSVILAHTHAHVRVLKYAYIETFLSKANRFYTTDMRAHSWR